MPWRTACSAAAAPPTASRPSRPTRPCWRSGTPTSSGTASPSGRASCSGRSWPQQAAGDRRTHGPLGQAPRPDQAGREVRHAASGGPRFQNVDQVLPSMTGKVSCAATRPSAPAQGSEAPHRLFRLLRHELPVPGGGGGHPARAGPQRLRHHHHGQHLLRPSGLLVRDLDTARDIAARTSTACSGRPSPGGHRLRLRQLQHPPQGVRRPAQGRPGLPRQGRRPVQKIRSFSEYLAGIGWRASWARSRARSPTTIPATSPTASPRSPPSRASCSSRCRA